jgi:hypothetical protein
MCKEEFKKFIGSRLEESSSVEQAMQAVLESKDTSAANKRQAKKVLALLSEPEVIDPAAKQWVARYMAALEKQYTQLLQAIWEELWVEEGVVNAPSK